MTKTILPSFQNNCSVCKIRTSKIVFLLKRIFFFSQIHQYRCILFVDFFLAKYALFLKFSFCRLDNYCETERLYVKRNIRIPSLVFFFLPISAHYAMDNPDLMPKIQCVSAEVSSFPSFSNAFFRKSIHFLYFAH